MGKYVIDQMRRCFCHAVTVARRADATAFAGEGDEKIMAAIIATSAGKAVCEDAALEVFVECLRDVGGRCVVIALDGRRATAPCGVTSQQTQNFQF